MIYQVLYLLCVWLPLRAKKELSREGQKTIQKYALETLCGVWAFIKGAKSQESTSHLYLPFFQAAPFTLRLNFSLESNHFLRAFMRHTLPVTFPGPSKQEKNIRFQECKYKYQVEGWAMQHSSRVRDIFPTFLLLYLYFYYSVVLPLSSLHKLK